MAKKVRVRVKTFIPEATIKDPKGDYFHGDDRGFSYTGSSRTKHDVIVNFDTGSITESKSIGKTCTVDPANNCARAPESDLQLENVKWNSAKDKVTFTMTCSSANPLVSGAPAIDYIFNVTVYKNDLRVCVYGDHDGFPNYEVYKHDYEADRTTAIFTYDHGDQTAWSLFPPMEEFFSQRCA